MKRVLVATVDMMRFRVGLLVVLVSTPVLAQTTHTVNQDGTADFTDIQSALDAAADGDTVLVAPGEYVITEPIDFNRLHDPEDPNSPSVKNISVRSGTGAEETAIRMADEPNDPSRGSVVIFQNRESEASELDGFTLTGGKGMRRGYYGGGGVSCENSSPRLTNCKITENMSHFLRVGCDATIGGGGLFCINSSPIVTNCTISANFGPGCGGGGGGGVLCEDNSSPTLIDCTIRGNYGGGVKCNLNSSPRLTNCTIAGNSGRRYGGGLGCNSNSSPRLTNCTIAGNWAEDGGGVYCWESSPTLTNCILWDNEGGSIHSQEPFQPQVTFSCIQGIDVWPGEGNINTDPLFVTSGVFDFEHFVTVEIGGREHQMPDFIVEAPDYHLQLGSPAIDAGTSQGAPPTDIEGNPRPCGDGIDIGAYEFQTEGCADRLFIRGDCDSDGFVGGTVNDALYYLNWAFTGGPAPECLTACDADADGFVGGSVNDPVYLLNWAFVGGPSPEPPFPDCGPGTEDDAALSCEIPSELCDVELTTWYRDSDSDAFGDPDVSIQAGSQPMGYIDNASDCDDTRADIYPEAPEFCDGIDTDCDGTEDEDFPLVGQPCDSDDADMCENGVYVCSADGTGVECGSETVVDILEVCNGVDDDCDGETDEEDPCNDDDPLTDDVCVAGECVFTPLPDGSPCDDELDCTMNDQVQGGMCVGEPYLCDDSIDCTTDICIGDGSCQFVIDAGMCLIDGECHVSGGLNPENPGQACDPATSQTEWTTLPDGSPCDDENDCTMNDQLEGGMCVGEPYSCDDSIACTTDVCLGDGTCDFVIDAGMCVIGGECIPSETLNPADSCQVCDPATSQTEWTAVPDCN